MQRLNTTVTLESVQRATITTFAAIADGVVTPEERCAIQRELRGAEGQARHADHAMRFANAIQRDTTTPVYLRTMAANANAPEFDPLEAA